ncbi:DUF4238 domain-containing protein [Methanomethylophilus alvi]|uniref:DUF4238 domain-containing protein n=1 Tax=Methanomethylophilus alvi TaxID=1291540 RepID=UPI0037DD9027
MGEDNVMGKGIPLPVNSHYVPRFILKNFGSSVNMYRRSDGTYRKDCPIESAYSKVGYYNEYTEKYLNERAEAEFSSILDKIVHADGDISLSVEQELKLKRFVMITLLRSAGCREVLIPAHRKKIKDLFYENPDRFMELWGKYSIEVADTTSDDDYWFNSLKSLLDLDYPDEESVYSHRYSTSYAWQVAVSLQHLKIMFWDAPETDEFILTDRGALEEFERNSTLENQLNNKLRIIDLMFRRAEHEEMCCRDNLFQFLSSGDLLPQNFILFPVSPRRAIILASPFFIWVYCHVVPEEYCKFSEIVTSFTDRSLISIKTPEKNNESKRLLKRRFTYTPVRLSRWQLFIFNSWILAQPFEWIAFSDSPLVIPSIDFRRYLFKLENDDTDDYDPLFFRLHEEYPDVTVLVDHKGKMHLPLQFMKYSGEIFSYKSIEELEDDCIVERIAAIIVLCRYGYSRYAEDLCEGDLLKLLSGLSIVQLKHWVECFEKHPDSLVKAFENGCGRVFREILAEKGDHTQYEVLGEDYLLGRYVPMNPRLAKHYLGKAVEHGSNRARKLLSDSF